MMLKEKLHNTKMLKGESVASYLSKLTQIRDESAIVGETIAEDELVCIALNGVLKH